MREVSKLSKSILVIDTPEKCEDCNFFYQYNKDDVDSAYCRVFGEEKKTSIILKPNWCPLKEIPKKKEPKKMHGDNLWGYHMSAFDKGYNTCINEILQ